MSPTRQAIVTALDTVTGVRGHYVIPDAPLPGDGWPVWESGQYRNGKLRNPITHTYSAFVVLPTGVVYDTVDEADGLVDQVMSALSKIGDVDIAEPVFIPVDATSTVPAIRVRVTPDPC